MKNVNDCFAQRLLRRIAPDPLKSSQSIELAKRRLKKARQGIDTGLFEFTILEAYLAMFHASRSILYKEGIQEKSHYAVFLYLKEKKAVPIHIINLLNIHRIERHEAMYGLDFEPTKEDAVTALEDAKEFVKAVKDIL